jgi:hypothetical protein
MSKELTTTEAINEFYRLKNKYEEYRYEKYIKPLVLSNKSKREKRQDYMRLPKPECINCKRNVGTIFSIKFNKEKIVRDFIVKCGDITDPCPLNIQIEYSVRERMDETIENDLKEIEQIKLDIIKEKNNLLFFSNISSDSTMEKFNELTEKLKDLSGITGYLIEKNVLVNNNPVKEELLKKELDNFGKEMLLPFKKRIQQFKETGDEQIVSEAIRFYINEMVPKLKQIQSMKYDITMVEYDEKSKEYDLIQIINSIANNEHFYEDDDKVLAFVKGVKKVAKSKSLKVKEIETNADVSRNLKKTKKIRKDIEEDKIVEEDQLDKETEKRILNSLPSEFKDEMLNYSEWFNLFLNNCVNSRKQGKPCKLEPAPNLFNEPILNKDTRKYEFGNELYNKVFEEQDKNYQKILLSLYKTDEEGNKDYTNLKEVLTDLIAKKLKLTNMYL